MDEYFRVAASRSEICKKVQNVSLKYQSAEANSTKKCGKCLKIVVSEDENCNELPMNALNLEVTSTKFVVYCGSTLRSRSQKEQNSEGGLDDYFEILANVSEIRSFM